jgi:hypothetical protein
MPSSLRTGLPEQRIAAGERRVNKMFDDLAQNERRIASRRQGSALKRLGKAATRGLRFAGPIAAGGVALRELMDFGFDKYAKSIEQGGDINSPEVEANRTIPTAVQQQKFKYEIPTQRARGLNK